VLRIRPWRLHGHILFRNLAHPARRALAASIKSRSRTRDNRRNIRSTSLDAGPAAPVKTHPICSVVCDIRHESPASQWCLWRTKMFPNALHIHFSNTISQRHGDCLSSKQFALVKPTRRPTPQRSATNNVASAANTERSPQDVCKLLEAALNAEHLDRGALKGLFQLQQQQMARQGREVAMARKEVAMERQELAMARKEIALARKEIATVGKSAATVHKEVEDLGRQVAMLTALKCHPFNLLGLPWPNFGGK
jgi:hypothetical protein